MYNYYDEPMFGTSAYCNICQSYIGTKSYKKYAEAESVMRAHMATAHPRPTVTYFEYHRPTIRELLKK